MTKYEIDATLGYIQAMVLNKKIKRKVIYNNLEILRNKVLSPPSVSNFDRSGYSLFHGKTY